MAQITVLNYPVELILEHDGTVVDTVTDEWGDHDVYEIHTVYWTEVAGQTWNAIVQHPGSGKEITRTISPGESDFINLAVPARFNSYPLSLHCSLNRG